MTTWFPIGLDGRSAINVMDGAYGATGGGTSADTTAISAAIAAMSTLGKKVLILPSGYTFLTSGLTYNVANSHIVIMPGATHKLAEADSNERLFTITAENVTVWLFGTMDGNYTAQGSVTGQSAIYATGDKVRVLGGNRMGRITGFRGNAVYGVDCDDFAIDGVRLDNILTRCVYGQLLTSGQTLKRFSITNCLGDRTAQGSGATEGVFEIENQAGGSNVIEGPILKGNHAYLHKDANAFCYEVYGGVAGGLVRPQIDDLYGEGGDATASFDHISGGYAKGLVGYNFGDKGIECAHCDEGFLVDDYHLDGNGNTGTTGFVIDNQSVNGDSMVVGKGTIKGVTSYGVNPKGASGGTKPKELVIGPCNVMSAAANFVAYYIEHAEGVRLVSPGFKGSGSGQRGIVSNSGSPGLVITDPRIVLTGSSSNALEIGAGATTITNPNLEGTGVALVVTDLTGLTVIGGWEKTFTRMVELVVNSGQTIDKIVIDGFSGDGSGDVALSNNGGTVGDNIKLHVPHGWTPYSILVSPRFVRFKGLTSSDSIIEGGIFTGDPNGTPVVYQGYAYYNGNLYTNKAGTWTAAN